MPRIPCCTERIGARVEETLVPVFAYSHMSCSDRGHFRSEQRRGENQRISEPGAETFDAEKSYRSRYGVFMEPVA